MSSHSKLSRQAAPFAILAGVLVSPAIVFWCLRHGFAYAPEPIGSRADLFVEGARATLLLTFLSGTLGIILGMILGLMKVSTLAVARWSSSAVIGVVRGTPLLVQILFMYYALPALVPWLKLEEFSAAMLALALNVGAYNAEVISAGIDAVPKGQREASKSLGLSSFQTMVFIILPQAFRIVIPPLINNLVALLKDSSLASSIGLLELTLAGNRISSETFEPVPVLTTIAVIYLVLTSLITGFSHLAEKTWKAGRA